MYSQKELAQIEKHLIKYLETHPHATKAERRFFAECVDIEFKRRQKRHS